MGKWGTTKAVHDQLTNVGSGWTFSNPENYYSDSEFTYDGLNSVGTGWTFSNPVASTYTQILDESVTVEADDSILFDDSVVTEKLYTADDAFALSDDVVTSWGVDTEDELVFAEEVELGHTHFAESDMEFSDEVFIMPILLADSLNIFDETEVDLEFHVEDAFEFTDDAQTSFGVDVDEPLGLSDDSPTTEFFMAFDDGGFDFADDATTNFGIDIDDAFAFADSVSVRRTKISHFSTQLAIGRQYKAHYGTQLDVAHYNAVSTNLPVTDPANVASPTIILNGDEVAVNVATQKGSGNQISLAWSNLLPCGFISWGVNLSIDGMGDFYVYANNQFAQIGDEITILGLKGTVDTSGPDVTDSGDCFLIKGFLGPVRELNREIVLTARNNDPVRNLAAQFPLQQPPSSEWSTVETAVKAIAHAAGITSLAWHAKDAPLTDIFIETGMKAGDAIRTLAARIGAWVFWDGVSSLVVMTPGEGHGGWAGIPDCRLFDKQGMHGPYKHLDMSKTRAAVLPVELLNQSTVVDLPPGLVKPSPIKVETLHVFDSKMKPDAPDLYIPVPGDFKVPAKVQVYVKPEAVTGATYETVDPNTWFDFVAGGVVTMDDKKKKLLVRASDIPSELRNGLFHMTVGYVRDTDGIDSLHESVVNAIGEQKKNMFANLWEKFRYFELETAEVQCLFFGSVPMPGNVTTITRKGNSITGKIKTVNITGGQNQPPILKFSMGNFITLNLDSALGKIDGIYLQAGVPT